MLLFHEDLELFRLTAPRCVEALTGESSEPFELTVYCDGTPRELMGHVNELADEIGADTVVRRRRERYVASGAPGNNAHRRLFPTRSRYLVVVEDDVVVYRTAEDFDVLTSARGLFETHSELVVLTKLDDHAQWAWKLRDVDAESDGSLRYVNRVATHLIFYDTERFMQVAGRFGAWSSDVFIDRDDWSYNWEDLVSHVGTTGARRIGFPESWPLLVYHCDEKIAPGSMYNTQDSRVKIRKFHAIEATHGARKAATSRPCG